MCALQALQMHRMASSIKDLAVRFNVAKTMASIIAEQAAATELYWLNSLQRNEELLFQRT